MSGLQDTEIKRLAALPLVQYERARKGAAEKLDVRPSILDRLVKDEQAKNKPNGNDGKQGHAISFPEPEPWPEEVDGALQLDEIATAIRRHVVMSDHDLNICALWVVHTFLLDHFLITPRLAIRSPTMGCGKTTLLDVLEHLVLKPSRTSNVTAAVTFRVIEQHQPTLLIDEAKRIGDKTDLLEVLNDGHRRGGQTLRNVAVGDNYEARAFATYAPLAIALIGSLPPELHDRSVVVDMKRRLPNERIEEMRAGRTKHLDLLARKIARWTKDHEGFIAAAEPEMPTGIYNREADNWKPLLAIADTAGGEWPGRARDAAMRRHAAADVADASQIELLLADIQAIGRGMAEMTSADLVKSLVALEGRPWAEMGNGRLITQNKLARMLKPLRITPGNIRVGGQVLKGYVFTHFDEAFDRYLSQDGGFNPLHRYNVDEMGTSTCFPSATPDPDVAVRKCEKSNNDGHCSGVAVAKGGNGHGSLRNDLDRCRAAPDSPTDDPDEGDYARVEREQCEGARADQPRTCAQRNAAGPPLYLAETTLSKVTDNPVSAVSRTPPPRYAIGDHWGRRPPPPDDNIDIPDVLLRCQLCGKPGAKRWDLHGRAVFLHEGCSHSWPDR
jgi:putative DNA primase/helicase